MTHASAIHKKTRAKLAKKYEARMAGTKAANDFSRPAGKRRK